MEPSDLNTHLPPRKRLLAGLRTATTACDAELVSSTVVSGGLAARLREMARAANASSASPQEMIEAASVAAAAAADAAAAARATAAEKAAVAAKARAAARAAMELLDSISRAAGASRSKLHGSQLKVKSRKKHVQVKLLYKPNGSSMGDAPKPRRRRESDEEIARNLHRVMNSSPRISHTGPKRPRSTTTTGDGKAGAASGEVEGEGVLHASNGSSLTQQQIGDGGLANGCAQGKSCEMSVPSPKNEGADCGGVEDPSRHTVKIRDSANNGGTIGNSSTGRRVKIKRKELLLNQHSSIETEDTKETEPSMHSTGRDASKSNGKGTEKWVSPHDGKASGDGLGHMKITSVWKFKKLKTSHCSTDSKVLHNMCSSPPSAAETSASLKAD